MRQSTQTSSSGCTQPSSTYVMPNLHGMCSHFFPWWGITPPSFCPLCGTALYSPSYYQGVPISPPVWSGSPALPTFVGNATATDCGATNIELQ